MPTSPTAPSLDEWLERQLQRSAAAMLTCLSPVDVVKLRPGFGQTMRPVAGSIVASRVLGAYDPDPDYFFHWFRDSAVIIDALRLLSVDGRIDAAEARSQLRDFVRFSLALNRLDGRIDAAAPDRRTRAAPDFQQFLRDDADLVRIHGDAVVAEARVNPDGTLDVSKWSRPQHDGPPLRALALLRWAAVAGLDAAATADLEALIRFDLGFTLRHWQEPSHDIWEEDNGHHYYTLRVSAAAFEAGAAWLERRGETADAVPLRAASQAVRRELAGYWVAGGAASQGYFKSRVLADGSTSRKALDIAVILSAIHAGGDDDHVDAGAHGTSDPRMQSTLAHLEALFDADYPINHARAADRGPAMGRYAGDVYYSGGAYYFSTLGAAEFCFRAAAHGKDAPQWFARGDAYLATVRAYTPADGALSEQFDQRDGTQTSAKQLAWSHAAFITCLAARRGAATRR